MTSQLTLVSHHLCPYVQRAAITLFEKDVPFVRLEVDLANKPDWFVRLSPLGKVPLLRVEAGADGETVLFESTVICEYLEDTQPNPLHPAEPLVRAHHRAWIEFASAALDDVAGFYGAKDEAAFEAKRTRLIGKFVWLERHLSDGPFFAGSRFALVDAAFGPLFRYFEVFERISDFGFFAGTPRVRAYRAALAARPSVQEAVAPDYQAQLMTFLRRRESHLSSLISADGA
jgi:glutathione S-transferase